ncbi:hypothetical protein CTEN210_08069 [Chaetoceros tenuissimus]|uniref:BUD13 homolog n=1 Tax=Chaetoceros tenuissimus TaxID=426638 RepID=A0AAD3CSX9_9STRA|nr:hypothetical protein CTEN210_08069 [Chaetoceros tenuissimus]
MSSKLDYLSKYTSSGEGDKKKKKKKKKKSKSRSYEHKIHDEADFDAYNSDQSNHLDEDAPVVVNEATDDIDDNTKNFSPWKDVEEERNESSKGRKSRKYDSDDEGSYSHAKRKKKSRRYDSDDDGDHRDSEKFESRRRYDSDDLSEKKSSKRKSRRYDSDDERRSNNNDISDDDLSTKEKKNSKRKSIRYDSDDEQEDRRKSKSRRRYDSDDDNRRKSRYDSDDEDTSERKSKTRRKRYDSDDSPNEDKSNARAKMSSGHSAGLQSSGAFKEAEEKLQRKNITNVENLERGETVYRNKDGKAVPISSSEKKYDEKESDPSWNLGTTQKRQMMQNNSEIEAIREGTFARSVDDVDKYKKDIARDGDPMMKYQTNTNKKIYKGPPPKPNRFGIRPGYRWDGIDRGNGFEDKVLASLYARGRKEEERYKWSCADM